MEKIELYDELYFIKINHDAAGYVCGKVVIITIIENVDSGKSFVGCCKTSGCNVRLEENELFTNVALFSNELYRKIESITV